MLTIVIPARNEAENIGKVILNIKKYVKQKYELFVINDASTDDTAKIAKKLGAKIIHHKIPQGGVVGDDFKKLRVNTLFLSMLTWSTIRKIFRNLSVH